MIRIKKKRRKNQEKWCHLFVQKFRTNGKTNNSLGHHDPPKQLHCSSLNSTGGMETFPHLVFGRWRWRVLSNMSLRNLPLVLNSVFGGQVDALSSLSCFLSRSGAVFAVRHHTLPCCGGPLQSGSAIAMEGCTWSAWVCRPSGICMNSQGFPAER